jgi:hypothetical protein
MFNADKRLTRLENQMEALRRGEVVICQELIILYKNRTITDESVQRIMRQLDALIALKPK